MHHPRYEYTQDEAMPATVYLGHACTPVWIQQKWLDGEYACYIQKNGCGHCCTAMALRLHGVPITPYEEFLLCLQMWGEPRQEETFPEMHFISARGIAKVLDHFHIPAQVFGIPTGDCQTSAQHIYDRLKEGKQVILWSHPSSKLPNNPFSSGDHYVLAVGLMEDGQILIANTSSKAAVQGGIQFTDVDTLAAVLYEGCEPRDYTWGRMDLKYCGGYVVVG